MREFEEHEVENPLDRAVSARLAKLRTMPVDTTALEKRVWAQIGRPKVASTGIRIPGRFLRAVAALLVVAVAIVAAIIAVSAGPVLATPVKLAQIHADVVSGASHRIAVSSVTQAAQLLSGQWDKLPNLPSMSVPVESCCLHHLGSKRVACISLTVDGMPITLAVAHASDMQSPQGNELIRNGEKYCTHMSGDLNMVMGQRNGQWFCLMGRHTTERLLELADTLKF